MNGKHRFHLRDNETLAIPEIQADDEATENLDEDDVFDNEFIMENVAIPEYHPKRKQQDHSPQDKTSKNEQIKDKTK